jgi:peptidyl-dipeptidase Dcp/oligopeptidase A
MERFNFHGEELAILKASLAEYKTFGIGLSNMGSASKLHSKIQMILNEYDRNQRKLNRKEKQSMIIDLTKTRWKLARALGYSSYSKFFLKDKLLNNPETVRKFLLSRCKESRTSSNFEFPNAFVKTVGHKWNSLHSICLQVLSFAKYFYGMDSSISADFPNSFIKILIRDIGTGKHLGTIFADLKARPDKCAQPSHFTILGSKKFVKSCLVTGISDSYQRPIVYISCNIQDPLEVSFDEIASMFHEFGHAFHGTNK